MLPSANARGVKCTRVRGTMCNYTIVLCDPTCFGNKGNKGKMLLNIFNKRNGLKACIIQNNLVPLQCRNERMKQWKMKSLRQAGASDPE